MDDNGEHFQLPAIKDEAAFERAVDEVAEATKKLLKNLPVKPLTVTGSFTGNNV